MAVTYDRTFENSVDGDMTKLSFELDHDIRCWMVWSSNILTKPVSPIILRLQANSNLLVQFMNECSLHDLGLLGSSRRTHSGSAITVDGRLGIGIQMLGVGIAIRDWTA